MQRESKRPSEQAPNETLETPRKKPRTRRGKVLGKSTQDLLLRVDNIHSDPSTATASTPSPIDRNSRKHENSTESTVPLPSSSTPTSPLLSLSSPVLGLSSVTIHPGVEDGPIGSTDPQINEPSQTNPLQLPQWITSSQRKSALPSFVIINDIQFLHYQSSEILKYSSPSLKTLNSITTLIPQSFIISRISILPQLNRSPLTATKN